MLGLRTARQLGMRHLGWDSRLVQDVGVVVSMKIEVKRTMKVANTCKSVYCVIGVILFLVMKFFPVMSSAT